MFDVGFWELSVIFIIALMVLGPERLPRVARDVGLWIGRLRRYVGTVREDIEREVHAQELRELINKPSGELDGLKEVISETKGALNQVKTELNAAERAVENDAKDAVGEVKSSAAADSAAAISVDKPASPAASVGVAATSASAAASVVAAEPTAEPAISDAPADDADQSAKAG